MKAPAVAIQVDVAGLAGWDGVALVDQRASAFVNGEKPVPLPTIPRFMPEPRLPLPRRPVLDWSSFRAIDGPRLPSVEDLPHKRLTTNGRAATHAALLQLKLPPGSVVLVPTYHCPSMVAPVIHAGLTPVFFGLRHDGLPRLEAIDPERAC